RWVTGRLGLAIPLPSVTMPPNSPRRPVHPTVRSRPMTRLPLLAAITVLTTLVATVPAVAQPGGNPIPGHDGVFELAWTGDISPPVGEARGDDYRTSETALARRPAAR